MIQKITYFEKPGAENTEEVLKIVKERAKELKIDTVIIASSRGNAAVKAVEYFKGTPRVIAVSHAAGFHEENVQEFTEENRKIFEKAGGVVITMNHSFTGVGAVPFRKAGAYLPGDIMAHTLRIFGQGMKVVCEIAMMAADAGLIKTGTPIISIAGTGQGSDTAALLTPVNSMHFFEMKINEILCKPRFTL